MEADIRRATRIIPKGAGVVPVDPRMSETLNGCYRARFIDWMAHRPKGRVLEVGCGPGWLTLELGRRGLTVDVYGLSPAAIAVANRMLAENPFREGFGQVNYHFGDVTVDDLGRER